MRTHGRFSDCIKNFQEIIKNYEYKTTSRTVITRIKTQLCQSLYDEWWRYFNVTKKSWALNYHNNDEICTLSTRAP